MKILLISSNNRHSTSSSWLLIIHIILFRHIKIVPDYESLLLIEDAEPSIRSKVVLATSADLNFGPSRKILFDWAPNASALLLLTADYYPDNSLAGQLMALSEASIIQDSRGRNMMQKFDIEFDVMACLDLLPPNINLFYFR